MWLVSEFPTVRQVGLRCEKGRRNIPDSLFIYASSAGGVGQVISGAFDVSTACTALM